MKFKSYWFIVSCLIVIAAALWFIGLTKAGYTKNVFNISFLESKSLEIKNIEKSTPDSAVVNNEEITSATNEDDKIVNNINKIASTSVIVPECDSFECLVSLTESCKNGSTGSVTFEKKYPEDTSKFGRYTYSVIFYGYDSEMLCKMNMKMESSIITTDSDSVSTDEEVRQLGKETNMSDADIEAYIKMKNGGVMGTFSQTCVGKNIDLANYINKWKNVVVSEDQNVTCVVE